MLRFTGPLVRAVPSSATITSSFISNLSPWTRQTTCRRRFFCSSTPILLVHTGKIKTWMSGRGFGFVEDDKTKQQHFVHFSSLKIEPGGYRSVTVGQEVEFDVAQVDGRSRAENVTAPGGVALPSGQRPADVGEARTMDGGNKKKDAFSVDF